MTVAVVLLSGGIDSATALALACKRHPRARLLALSFDYGQRHRRELLAAAEIAAHYRVLQRVETLSISGSGRSSLTGGDGALSGAPTVVRGRNLHLLASAANVAESLGAGVVWFGGHRGDFDIYQDCRPQFVSCLNRTLEAMGSAVRILQPFASWTKRRVVEEARCLGVPLGLTWSCYAGGEEPCGACGACRERMQAMGDAGDARREERP